MTASLTVINSRFVDHEDKLQTAEIYTKFMWFVDHGIKYQMAKTCTNFMWYCTNVHSLNTKRMTKQLIKKSLQSMVSRLYNLAVFSLRHCAFFPHITLREQGFCRIIPIHSFSGVFVFYLHDSRIWKIPTGTTFPPNDE